MAERWADLHKGHRKRMKQQLLVNGLDSMNDHQVIEMMLFFSIPRGDTNELAHILVNECGSSFVDVLNTDFNDLLKIKGIGEHTAFFLYFIRLICKRYNIVFYTKEHSESMGNSTILCGYFEKIFLGARNEEFHVAALDDNYELVKEKKLDEGGFSSVKLNPWKIIDFVRENKCSNIAIAHNHPTGTFLPSKEDVELTAELVNHFSFLNIQIVDHIVVGREGSYSMRSSLFKPHIWGD